jgi:hypothetical protein
MQLEEIREKWEENKHGYTEKEIGGGIQSFIKDIIKSEYFFNLKEIPKKTNQKGTFTHDTEKGKSGRPDFVLYITDDITIPIEAKCYTRITEGEKQISLYQTDYPSKQYGILTDGNEWRFYRAQKYKKFFLDDMLNNHKDFQIYWQEYIKSENYYSEVLCPSGQLELFENKLDLNEPENRAIFFEDITKLIRSFKAKMGAIGAFGELFNMKEQYAIETSYAYFIQFILYKVLVDNDYEKFQTDYDKKLTKIRKSLQDKDFYSIVINEIKDISEYISKKIYRPFAKEQQSINKKLAQTLKGDITIEDIAPWLDIIVFINKYNFANLRNEIFGFIYENYLKDLYGNENKGQYFTDPAVVNFMLEQIGYTEVELKNKNSDEISLIDPSCGAGTFLYSAVDKIIRAFEDGTKERSKYIENLTDKNIFGLDIAEFPLFLAEMSILMRLLPLIVNDNYQNPIDNKLKIFKTKDSISEFLDVGISSKIKDENLFSHLEETALDYPSFMREEDDLKEMFLSLQKNMGQRKRFDYVIGNPPYIGYNASCKQKQGFTLKLKDKSLLLNNVYGANLHSVPGKNKKYRPNPNLYAFFIVLGMGLLKDNGKLCYIIPQTMLTAVDLDVVRYHLAKNTKIEKIITFEGNLFIGRGLKQNKPVATSSLIFVCKKTNVLSTHKVEIITHDSYGDKKGLAFEAYINSRKKQRKKILQSELLAKIENWNFIKQDNSYSNMLEMYQKNTEDMAFYYNHDLAKRMFGNSFWFDGGYSIDEKQMSKTEDVYIYPKFDNNYFTLKSARGYWPNIRSGNSPQTIELRQGNQEYNLLDSKYKIIWSYANARKFFFTDKPVVWARNQFNAIGSNNKQEIYYLFALLNSQLNFMILSKMLKNENEKGFLIAGKSIKQYIRVPKITEQNKAIKDEIIKQTEIMLVLEDVLLKDRIDFSKIGVQKFNNIFIENDKLILTKEGFSCKLPIPKSQTQLVSDAIYEKYGQKDKNIFGTEIKLAELKMLPVIDFSLQAKIKDYIDDLIFSLYFGVKIGKIGIGYADKIKVLCQKSQFYDISPHAS